MVVSKCYMWQYFIKSKDLIYHLLDWKRIETKNVT